MFLLHSYQKNSINVDYYNLTQGCVEEQLIPDTIVLTSLIYFYCFIIFYLYYCIATLIAVQCNLCNIFEDAFSVFFHYSVYKKGFRCQRSRKACFYKISYVQVRMCIHSHCTIKTCISLCIEMNEISYTCFWLRPAGPD